MSVVNATEFACIVAPPPSAIKISPLTSPNTASLTILKSALLTVPASDTISSSVSATSPVISPCPLMTSSFNIAPVTFVAPIETAPASVIVTSPLTVPNIELE